VSDVKDLKDVMEAMTYIGVVIISGIVMVIWLKMKGKKKQ